MAIIGPRPLLVRYLARYNEEQHHRHDVRPGLTGYAQAHGRNAVSWEDKFAMDVWYTTHITFVGDELGGIQFRKPNDIAFRIMQNRWRVPFEQLVYVGDNPNKDFQAPRQLGMRWIYLFNKNGIYSNKNYKDRICYGIDNLEKTLLYK